MFRIDFDDPEIEWHLLDGDSAPAPGIAAVLTPGHTPGHQSFVVDLPDGSGYVFIPGHDPDVWPALIASCS
jgi:glyoxylase-like metal-dependent hydrolase (beta-lactamase superfamily II)